jgi:membrane-bound lytic murein transglycosylase B
MHASHRHLATMLVSSIGAGLTACTSVPQSAGAQANVETGKCPIVDARIDSVWFARNRVRYDALAACVEASVGASAASTSSDAVPLGGDAGGSGVSGAPVIRIEPAPSAPSPPGGPSEIRPQGTAPSNLQTAAASSERMRRLAEQVDEVARRNEIDPLLLHALIYVESRYRSDAVSPAGARGAMQLMPATAERFGVQRVAHLHDDGFNLAAGAAYLKVLQAEVGGSLDLVLAAYNAGEGAVRRYGGLPPYPETQAYVRDVIAQYRLLQSRRSSSDVSASATPQTQ